MSDAQSKIVPSIRINLIHPRINRIIRSESEPHMDIEHQQ